MKSFHVMNMFSVYLIKLNVIIQVLISAREMIMKIINVFIIIQHIFLEKVFGNIVVLILVVVTGTRCWNSNRISSRILTYSPVNTMPCYAQFTSNEQMLIMIFWIWILLPIFQEWAFAFARMTFMINEEFSLYVSPRTCERSMLWRNEIWTVFFPSVISRCTRLLSFRSVI